MYNDNFQEFGLCKPQNISLKHSKMIQIFIEIVSMVNVEFPQTKIIHFKFIDKYFSYVHKYEIMKCILRSKSYLNYILMFKGCRKHRRCWKMKEKRVKTGKLVYIGI